MGNRPVCGFVGLGSQGAPIARRIIDAGYQTLLWARRPQTLEPFRETTAVIAASLLDLASQADHVGICVTDDAAVRSVCDELMPAMRAGSRIAIHSTTLPSTCRELAQEAAARELVFIEAPVSGGAPAAAAGALTLMVAGSSEALAIARPVFESFASLIVHLGEFGNGQIAKLINNTLMVANLGLAHSAVSMADELQLERSALLDLLAASSGRSYALEVYARQSSLAAFSNHAALLEKVQLLGSVAGEQHPAMCVLRAAAHP
jgi:3-hydroxyisobutyrate dehydrogenase